MNSKTNNNNRHFLRTCTISYVKAMSAPPPIVFMYQSAFLFFGGTGVPRSMQDLSSLTNEGLSLCPLQ